MIMSKEQIAIELTKIYFSIIKENASEQEIINIYVFFLEGVTPKIEIDPSVLSKIKPIN